MSFAQQGPPASAKQIAYIQALMAKAGYDDFRSARTEYRLTQRQAKGKFTKSEASAMIDRLTSADDENPTVSVKEEPETLDSAQALLIRGFPADVLADELRRCAAGLSANRSSPIKIRSLLGQLPIQLG